MESIYFLTIAEIIVVRDRKVDLWATFFTIHWAKIISFTELLDIIQKLVAKLVLSTTST